MTGQMPATANGPGRARAMRHGGAHLVECLLALGATRAFGVPGESYLPVLDALHDTVGRLDFTLCRHEGAAAFMAEAWGKLSGQPGIALVTRGPGATNAAIGVHAAMQSSTPMILFVGQVGTDLRGREAFQELDYRAVFGSMAKWVTEIDQIDRLSEIVSRAWSMAMSGRPGPVVIALPEDVLSAYTDRPVCARPALAQPAASTDTLARLHTALKSASRPLVMAGGSGWTSRARDDLARFLENWDLPAVVSFRRHDLIDNHAETYAGEAGVGMTPHVRGLIGAADLILALNIRFGEMSMDAYSLSSPPDLHARLCHAHPSAEELNKIYRADIAIQAGPETLLSQLVGMPVETGNWADWRRDARAGFRNGLSVPAQPGPVDMGEILRHLQEQLPSDAILTNGAGNFAIWPNKHFLFGSRQILLAPQSGAMGYGVPAAIAARLWCPGRVVVCFAGDGDFQMTGMELGTAVQAGACPIILIVNNGTYGTIRMHQERNFPGRVSGTTLENPDFVALAQSYGLFAKRIEDASDFPAALEFAISAGRGAVFDLVVGQEALTPSATLSQIRARGKFVDTTR